MDFVHVGSVKKRNEDGNKHKQETGVLHYVSVVTGNTQCSCYWLFLCDSNSAVPARAKNMDPQYPDEKEEHRHADVEFGERNLSSRQEAVRILLLYVDLKSDQFNSLLSKSFKWIQDSAHFIGTYNSLSEPNMKKTIPGLSSGLGFTAGQLKCDQIIELPVSSFTVVEKVMLGSAQEMEILLDI